MVGECQCTWGPAEGLEEDMKALDLEDNIPGEDFAEWSECDDTRKVHSVHGDSTEVEMTDTSSDDMSPLVDAADDSDHDDSEVPALFCNVILAMPAYPASPAITIQYLDDVLHIDNMTTSSTTRDLICYTCNLPCYGSYESHVYECNRHIYCAYHNRWESPRHGHIRCDAVILQRMNGSRCILWVKTSGSRRCDGVEHYGSR
jgi:hypothetical protein